VYKLIYWLLLCGGMLQSVPSNCDHFLNYCVPHLSSNHSWFIQQILWQILPDIYSREAGKTRWKWPLNFACQYLYQPQGILNMGSKAEMSHIVRFYGMLKNSWSPTGMNRLNSHFFPPSSTRSRDVSGDGQSALVDKLAISPSRSCLLTGSHRYHLGIVQ
jgi:hypothetical protein